ncbi:MAG: hypothetical protein IPK72_21860 [Candidatus Eisenbacteria bacterium]|nr:hypothetical protein [Candidatus Eisenbacteria bacterium]
MQVVGDIAYVCLSDGLWVVDVTDPRQPRELGYAEGYPTGFRISVHGEYAYQASDLAGLQIYEISDPTQPRRIGGDDTGGSAFGIASNDDHVVVSDYGSGLYVFRHQCPVTRFSSGVEAPAQEILLSAWPNPSRGAVRVTFEAPERSSGTVGVFDASGRRVRILAEGEFVAGMTAVSWDGHGDDGHPLRAVSTGPG